MTLEVEDDVETVEGALSDMSSVVQEQIEEIVSAHPIRSLVVAFVAGIVLAKFVL